MRLIKGSFSTELFQALATQSFNKEMNYTYQKNRQRLEEKSGVTFPPAVQNRTFLDVNLQ